MLIGRHLLRNSKIWSPLRQSGTIGRYLTSDSGINKKEEGKEPQKNSAPGISWEEYMQRMKALESKVSEIQKTKPTYSEPKEPWEQPIPLSTEPPPDAKRYVVDLKKSRFISLGLCILCISLAIDLSRAKSEKKKYKEQTDIKLRDMTDELLLLRQGLISQDQQDELIDTLDRVLIQEGINNDATRIRIANGTREQLKKYAPASEEKDLHTTNAKSSEAGIRL